MKFAKFVAAGNKAYLENPLPDDERVEYNGEIDLMKQVGLALRIYATNHKDEYPESLEQLFAIEGLVPESIQAALSNGRYEYNRFKRAETKPQLPAVWWRASDERGIRVLVLNDGSAHVIREPAGLQTPGVPKINP